MVDAHDDWQHVVLIVNVLNAHDLIQRPLFRLIFYNLVPSLAFEILTAFLHHCLFKKATKSILHGGNFAFASPIPDQG